MLLTAATIAFLVFAALLGWGLLWIDRIDREREG